MNSERLEIILTQCLVHSVVMIMALHVKKTTIVQSIKMRSALKVKNVYKTQNWEMDALTACGRGLAFGVMLIDS